ncbi:MAG: ABC transporter substrate-binding protein, partial [Pseudomonadota bacterium]
MSKKLLGAVSAIAMLAGTAAQADDHKLRIGVMATLEGTYTVLGEDGVRGIKTALAAFGGKAAGKEIELVIQSTDASPDSAVRAARKLVEQDGLDVIIGPLSGSEGIAIRDYSKTQPQATFINGSSGAQETTFVNPSENFFRFNSDGAQWSWGLGKYVHDVKGYETVATIGEDYSF